MSGTHVSVDVRAARHDDYEDIEAFTTNTWPERDGGDYIPDVYHDWIEGDRRRTAVAEVGGEVAGIAQCVMLSEWEAWCQGMRVNPEFRGRGVSVAVTEDLFDWAREQGATVARNMVFSWNVAGLGQSRAAGFDPATEFRWAHPEPRPDSGRGSTDGSDAETTADPNAAWRFWTDSDARDRLGGLALDPEETWAVSQLTREHLRAAADEDGLFVVQDDGTRGFAHRVREYERQAGDDDGSEKTERWVEYGVGAWADAEGARAVLDAVARDAADRGADRTRVLIPESVRHVSDVAYCRVEVSDEPDFVLGADLTR
ncbi:GNAT family N-acetyltransferase [Halorussus rarus]|uniref:GNAT family N-acetyltransferase n=1 Tax=Halorussus TaxID=1070314 RepID=UPI000E2110DB|nr:GNAT family N-acetyltransferase [Halorussus rarus]NHN59919.1 GNAT family N-acetyltransferase [Halorussus sp. JP-T4]